MEKDPQNFIHTLWDELADFDAAHTDEAMRYLMSGLCTLVGAFNVSWTGAIRLEACSSSDPVKGWRPRVASFLHPADQLDEKVREQRDKVEGGSVDITIVRNAEGAGTFRVNRLRDIVGAEWFESSYYQTYYQRFGMADAIWVSFPVNEDAESVFGIFSSPERPPFTEAERDVVGYALRGIKWFHRQLMLSHGMMIAKVTLTSTERRVLHLLLTGFSEKLIAAELGQSPHTTHEYVGSIFRKFGVNNRAALMALWLGKTD